MFRVFARVALFVLVSGCAATVDEDPKVALTKRMRQCSYPITYKIANNIQAIYHKPIQDGVEYWNYLLEKEVFVFGGFFAAGFEDTSDFLPIYLTYFPIDGLCGVTSFSVMDEETACMGKTRIDLIAHNLGHCVMWGKFESVVRHEAAHALGLGHTDKPGFLMSPNLDQTQEHPIEAASWEILKLREKVHAELTCQ